MTAGTQLPKVKVECAFASDPLATSPTWTDITNYVTAFEITRGRQHELSRMEAGTCRVTLNDSRDRRFDPSNTAGAYYPNVLPMKKLRVSAQWNLLTAEQASFEGATTAGWAVDANCTLSNSTTFAEDGSHSMRVSSVAAGDMGFQTTVGTGGIPVTVGQVYSGMLSGRTEIAGVARTFRLDLRWLSSAGTLLSSTTGSNFTDSTSGFVQGTVSGTAPPGAAYVALYCVRKANGGPAEHMYVDEAGVFPVGSVTVWSPGGPYYLFTGYVESWPMGWASYASTEVKVEAVDGFKVLNLKKVAGTQYRAAVLASSPTGYWPLYEKLGTVADDLGSGNNDGTYTGAVTLGVPGANPGDIDTAADMGAQTGWVSVPQTAGFAGTGDFTVEFWVYPRSIEQFGGVGAAEIVYQGLSGSFAADALSVLILADGTVRLIVSDFTDGGHLTSATPVTMNAWNHVVAVKSGTTGPGNWNIYINGTVSNGVTTIDGAGNPSLTLRTVAFAAEASVSLPFAPNFDGILQHVAFYNSALSSGTVTTHYNTAGGFTSQSLIGNRLGEILDVVGWPAGDRNLDAGQFYMQPITQPLYTVAALEATQQMTDSEGFPAVVFIDGAGNVVFQDRGHAIPASAATFGDAPGELPYVLSGTDVVLDDTDIWNEIVYQADNGQPQLATDATSQTAYVKRTLSKTGLKNANDADVAAMADADLARYKTPRIRAKKISATPTSDPGNLYPQVLGLDLNDRITVKRTGFTGGGSTMTLDVRIEGVHHQYQADPGTFVTGWQLAPTNPGNLVILGSSEFGLLAGTAVLA